MEKTYIVKEIDGRLYYDNILVLKSPKAFKQIDHEIRLKILKLLNKKPMYPIELAKALGLHEQKVYYHINQLIKAQVIDVAEKKEIRGTTAKKFKPKQLNFALSLDFKSKNFADLKKEGRNKSLDEFMFPFIKNQKLNSKIIVGSPDPHGPFKARARDGHYAIDLALYLGSICSITKDFSTQLDVDINLENINDNLILVGGPVTNLAMAKINEMLPAKFSDKKPWGIVGKKTHTDENIGLIAKIPNPFNKDYYILIIAGIRFSGTKTAVLALTRFNNLVLSRYTDQKEFYAIVEGFDLDGDGKVDSVELVE